MALAAMLPEQSPQLVEALQRLTVSAAKEAKVCSIVSRLKEQIARLLKEEGYISDFRVEKGESFDMLVIELKFGRNRERIITDLKRISKPGRRIYARKDRPHKVLGGMGVAILSTSTGVVTGRQAQEKGVGGEVLCYVW